METILPQYQGETSVSQDIQLTEILVTEEISSNTTAIPETAELSPRSLEGSQHSSISSRGHSPYIANGMRYRLKKIKEWPRLIWSALNITAFHLTVGLLSITLKPNIFWIASMLAMLACGGYVLSVCILFRKILKNEGISLIEVVDTVLSVLDVCLSLYDLKGVVDQLGLEPEYRNNGGLEVSPSGILFGISVIILVIRLNYRILENTQGKGLNLHATMESELMMVCLRADNSAAKFSVNQGWNFVQVVQKICDLWDTPRLNPESVILKYYNFSDGEHLSLDNDDHLRTMFEFAESAGLEVVLVKVREREEDFGNNANDVGNSSIEEGDVGNSNIDDAGGSDMADADDDIISSPAGTSSPTFSSGSFSEV